MATCFNKQYIYSYSDFNLEQHEIIHDMYDVTCNCPMNCVMDYFINKVIIFYQKHLSQLGTC